MHEISGIRHTLSTFWGRLATSSLSELVELFGNKIPWPDGDPSRRDRVFNQWRTFWLFLTQVLSFTQTCGEALKKAQAFLCMNDQTISSSTAAYCKARIRLSQQYLSKINHEIVEKLHQQLSPADLWYGRHVKIVDGSSASMPDTRANQDAYPQPSGQKKGCGFPVMRIVVIFSLTTGLVVALRKGSLKIHERTLWRKMWSQYQKGDVVLADRGFCAFADYFLLAKKGVDCVMRLHQMRKEKKIIKKFNKKDYLVQWQKAKRNKQSAWITRNAWKRMPQDIIVRHVHVSTDLPGYRTKKLIIATTLLDNKKYPGYALAELYRKRWMAELFLRDIKTTMRMDNLRCKTPEMIQKELTIFIIAYNLIRSLIWKAAKNKGLDPYHISFASTMATIRQWTPLMVNIGGENIKKRFIDRLLEVVAQNLISKRKKRRKAQPRAIKRRPNGKYQLMTKPRNQFKEIPHREKYRKNSGLS